MLSDRPMMWGPCRLDMRDEPDVIRAGLQIDLPARLAKRARGDGDADRVILAGHGGEERRASLLGHGARIRAARPSARAWKYRRAHGSIEMSSAGVTSRSENRFSSHPSPRRRAAAAT